MAQQIKTQVQYVHLNLSMKGQCVNSGKIGLRIAGRGCIIIAHVEKLFLLSSICMIDAKAQNLLKHSQGRAYKLCETFEMSKDLHNASNTLLVITPVKLMTPLSFSPRTRETIN